MPSHERRRSAVSLSGKIGWASASWPSAPRGSPAGSKLRGSAVAGPAAAAFASCSVVSPPLMFLVSASRGSLILGLLCECTGFVRAPGLGGRRLDQVGEQVTVVD